MMGDEKSMHTAKRTEVELRNLEDLLREKLGNGLIVDNFTTSNLVPPGENYGSTMLKVNAMIRRHGVNSKSEELSLVAKMVPPTEIQRIIFETPVTFRKEIYIFTDIVPTFKDLERECGIPETEIFDQLPEFYGSRLSLDKEEDKFDDDAVILMENLKLKNYACGDRRIGVDLAHAKSVVEAMARFHALGIAVKIKRPQLFEEFKLRLKPKNANVGDEIIGRFVLTNAKKLPKLLPHIPRIEQLVLRYHSDLLKAPIEPWGSIVHTDLWVNNVMFRDDVNGNPEDTKFIDFQHYTYQNPMRDLVFFLFTSCETEVRVTHIEDLIDLYYEKFISHLATLKCDANSFSRNSFNELFADAASLEYLHSVFMIRLIIMDPETEFGGMPETEVVFEVEPTHEYRDRFTELTLKFIEKNWI